MSPAITKSPRPANISFIALFCIFFFSPKCEYTKCFYHSVTSRSKVTLRCFSTLDSISSEKKCNHMTTVRLFSFKKKKSLWQRKINCKERCSRASFETTKETKTQTRELFAHLVLCMDDGWRRSKWGTRGSGSEVIVVHADSTGLHCTVWSDDNSKLIIIIMLWMQTMLNCPPKPLEQFWQSMQEMLWADTLFDPSGVVNRSTKNILPPSAVTRGSCHETPLPCTNREQVACRKSKYWFVCISLPHLGKCSNPPRGNSSLDFCQEFTLKSHPVVHVSMLLMVLKAI